MSNSTSSKHVLIQNDLAQTCELEHKIAILKLLIAKYVNEAAWRVLKLNHEINTMLVSPTMSPEIKKILQSDAKYNEDILSQIKTPDGSQNIRDFHIAIYEDDIKPWTMGDHDNNNGETKLAFARSRLVYVVHCLINRIRESDAKIEQLEERHYSLRCTHMSQMTALFETFQHKHHSAICDFHGRVQDGEGMRFEAGGSGADVAGETEPEDLDWELLPTS